MFTIKSQKSSLSLGKCYILKDWPHGIQGYKFAVDKHHMYYLVYDMTLMHALWLNQYWVYRLPDWLIDSSCAWILNKLCERPPQYALPASWSLTFWPWKYCSSHVTWATSVPILVFLRLSFYRLMPDVRDRQTSDRRQVALPLLLIPCYFVF